MNDYLEGVGTGEADDGVGADNVDGGDALDSDAALEKHLREQYGDDFLKSSPTAKTAPGDTQTDPLPPHESTPAKQIQTLRDQLAELMRTFDGLASRVRKLEYALGYAQQQAEEANTRAAEARALYDALLYKQLIATHPVFASASPGHKRVMMNETRKAMLGTMRANTKKRTHATVMEIPSPLVGAPHLVSDEGTGND